MTTILQIGAIHDIDGLVQTDVIVGVDTEFEGPTTITSQFATRDLDGQLRFQVYRDPDIAEPLAFNLGEFIGDLEEEHRLPRDCQIGILTQELSPARVIGDLLRIAEIIPVPRTIGYQQLRNPDFQPANGEWDPQRQCWRVPSIDMVLVGHFLPADLGRIFGRNFYRDVFQPVPGVSDINLTCMRRLSFTQGNGVRANHRPIVEFAGAPDGRLYAIRLKTIDTTLPFGPGSLDRHCQAFLRARKIDTISPEEKRHMVRTFQRRPAESFGYAIRDVLLQLRLYEEMRARDRAIFESFGIPSDDIPEMRGTVGGRVATFLTAATKASARGSEKLQSALRVKKLMRSGGMQRFAPTHGGSRFGQQTGAVHGGLGYSRTPTAFWHEAPGMLRDVDMRSCYSEILQRTDVYWGCPVIWEPGDRRITLAQAVEFVGHHAAADAWFIRATGNIRAMPNTLIPSTLNAVTYDNFRRRRPAQHHLDAEAGSVKFTAKLFSERIESGVFTAATWAVIQALPEAVRREYEALRLESLILYPSKFVAQSGREYDELFDAFYNDGLSWTADLDIDGRRLVETITLDHDYVCLRFPITEYARRIEDFRREARSRRGAGSAEELMWKLQNNTQYGVFASPHHVTNNIVAANQITAKARASAWVLFKALNGLQVITDGCSYRRDHVPACTFRECLERQRDYPLRHADGTSGIPFCDPAGIPDDEGFNGWLRQHVGRFFELDGSALDRLLSHQLEHKLTGTTGSASFDALACDGSGNYIKFLASDGAWVPHDTKMRGYGRESKEVLEPWIINTYRSDMMRDLSPVTADCVLMKLEPAMKAAKRALRGCPGREALLPLGYARDVVKAFSALKLSAFVCQNPRQYRAIQRQLERLQHEVGCKLDLLALRRAYGPTDGSLSGTARTIYQYINSGGQQLMRAFNLRSERLSHYMESIIGSRQERIGACRSRAEAQLRLQILMYPEDTPTGIMISGGQGTV